MTELRLACQGILIMFQESGEKKTILKLLRGSAWVLLIIAFSVRAGFSQANEIDSGSAKEQTSQNAVHDLPTAQVPPADCSLKHPERCLLNVASDQAGIWTSPLRLHVRDLLWLVPLSAAIGTSIHYDSEAMQEYGFPNSGINFGHQVSRFSSPYVSFGAAGALYLLGGFSKSPNVKHAGLTGAEAVVDTLILTEGIKLATNRDRPYQGDGTGKFWPHGTRSYNLDSSMPSQHAAAAWALARVMSSEFPDKPWLRILCYGAATTVSASRVLSRDHFPSDALVGTAFGYLVGGYVERRRSDQYWDSISYSVTPVVQSSSHSYGLALSFDPGTLHLGPRLNFSHSKALP